MAGIGANGSVTTTPHASERVCASCEHWCGFRKTVNNGYSAATADGQPATCSIMHKPTYPLASCTCPRNSYEKWHELK